MQATGLAPGIKVRVVPNAKKTCAAGMMDDGETLRVRLAAPPVDGKANRELIAWVAASLGMRASSVQILGGEHARTKIIRIEGIVATEARERLAAETE